MATGAKKALLRAAAAAVIALAAAGAYVFYVRSPAPEPPPPPVVAEPAAPVPEPTVVAPPANAPLPGLDESDTEVRGWLSDVFGAEALARFLVPDSIVRKLVATVDNLPRQKLDIRVRVARPLEGLFPVERNGEELFLGPATYARYEPFMEAVQRVDPDKVADLYVRIYPLLQQAYAELGYPGKEFHVRVLEAIDDALAAPAIDGPVHAALAREKLIALRAALVARSTAP